MLKVGEWRKVQIGGMTVIGYVSSIVQSGFQGYEIELTKVIRIKDGEFEFRTPVPGIFTEEQLEPIDDFWDKYQDKSALIDLALLTKDEQWFKELIGGKQQWHTVEQSLNSNGHQKKLKPIVKKSLNQRGRFM
ncbi:hypothetical protein M3221_13685 [Domibacillus indicus]|uniref:hypothetical protein n=1 Tax=Domibacillus indicus TaxID=1437523 RepID=UPI002040D223|nr:hypothetical protein [Domibacillus indicus]MCM3789452.1 hypothetical protein [Domibacillus indicus]